MRPPLLYPLFSNLSSFPGIGASRARLIERLCGERVIDLLWHLPSTLAERVITDSIVGLPTGTLVGIQVTVLQHRQGHGRQPWRVICCDSSENMELVFFKTTGEYLNRQLPVGHKRFIVGRLERYSGHAEIIHPEQILDPKTVDPDLIKAELIYRLTNGITLKTLKSWRNRALNQLPSLPEWLRPSFLEQNGWKSWNQSIIAVHLPTHEAVDPKSPARMRLAYDELLANQLALALMRRQQKELSGIRRVSYGDLVTSAIQMLPYTLTQAQKRVLEEILDDICAPTRMLRLLQGDVGSGKTVVAALAILAVVESGAQCAFLAPTELLANQHAATMIPLLAAVNVRAAVFTGRDRGKSRTKLLSDLVSGEIKVVIGTHALIEENVVFARLGLAVIDEQHRFGVAQRLALTKKGDGVDLLAMTATPIPRTLAMTAYGDLDISRIDQKLPGRQPVDTRLLSLEKIEDVISAIGRKITAKARVYWVCQAIDEQNEVNDGSYSAVTSRFEALSARFGERVGLIHGRMKAAERDSAMAAFAAGDIDLLVATTIIEVGVDVPEASIMVVENAERFGLSQLHQLRGRVGRGQEKSTCILLYSPPLSAIAAARLKIMRETEDGFRIAEEDLFLRGSGEVLGTRQSGLPDFRLADLAIHSSLLYSARDEVAIILREDVNLTTARGKALRLLLQIFQREFAAQALNSG